MLDAHCFVYNRLYPRKSFVSFISFILGLVLTTLCIRIPHDYCRYVYSRGMSEANLAWARGGGAIFGLIGTLMYPHVHKAKGVVNTGGVTNLFQVRAALYAPIVMRAL